MKLSPAKLAYHAAYREANRDRIGENRRKYYAANVERIRAVARARRAADPAKASAQERAYYAAHKEGLNVYDRERYARNRESIRLSVRAKRRERRLEVLAAYGGRCTCCGETESDFLALDHINGGGAAHRREIIREGNSDGGSLYRWARKNGHPPLLQILCHNCNLAKGFYGTCPHRRQLASTA